MEHRPCRGRSKTLDGLAPHARKDPQRVHVGVLALARPHADGREAFEQLAAVEAFLAGVLQVPQLEVFVEVHEFLAERVTKHRIGMCRTLPGWNRCATCHPGAKADPPSRTGACIA